MKISEEKFERLLRFLDAEMDPGELAAFENELKADPDLREQLDFQLRLSDAFSEKKLNEPVTSENNEAFKSTLLNARNKFLIGAAVETAAPEIHEDSKTAGGKTHGQVVHVNFSHRLAAASVIAFALIASLVYYSGRKPKDDHFSSSNDTINHPKNNGTVIIPQDTIKKQTPEESSHEKVDYASLAEKNYKKDKVPTDPPQLLANEMSDFNSGNYLTIQAFDVNNIPKTRGNPDERAIKELGHYYIGLSFIETKNNEQALLNLKWVTDHAKDESLKVKAAWYQAIIYLKMDDVKNAEILLVQVASTKTGTIYKQKAEELMRQIKP